MFSLTIDPVPDPKAAGLKKQFTGFEYMPPATEFFFNRRKFF